MRHDIETSIREPGRIMDEDNNHIRRSRQKSRNPLLREDLPSKESMRKGHRHLYAGKITDYTTTPVVRFLHKQVGRNWNKVHSEVCKAISKRTERGRLILRYTLGDVEQNVVYKEGSNIPYTRGWRGRLEEHDGFWVDKQGLLRSNNTKESKARREAAHTARYRARNPKTKEISLFESYAKIDGFWYILGYTLLKKGETAFDILERKTVRSTGNTAAYEYREYKDEFLRRVPVSRRQISKKEVLDNDLHLL